VAASSPLSRLPGLDELTSDLSITTAESILEAVLVSGNGPGSGGRSETGVEERQVILVDIAGELEHLEAGTRSLRRVNPAARILLLCDPIDEVAARRARLWGADDYFIVPLDVQSLRSIVTDWFPAEAAATNAPAKAGAANRPAGPFAATGELPAIPLMAQTELLEDLLAGRPDFVDHALATLQRYVKLEGRLVYVPGPERSAGNRGQCVSRPVALGDEPTLGTLILEGSQGPVASGSPALLATISQIANWLASLLAISRRYEQLRSLATTDELSGAFNRRYFLSYMARLLERARENRSRVTLLLFDIDDFKKYNDTFGHASGDAIIRELIQILRACTRQYDLVARIGGDEFAVVYRDNEAPRQPNSEHPRDVLAATERFREAIRNHHWPETCKIEGDVSISGGLATFPWDADTLESLMAKADEALLQAKSAGKNVILMHKRETTPEPPRGVRIISSS
jgi:diguanylate cyclase (GGDEF)-like protein